MKLGGLPEGTPILCRNCGAGMTLRADASVWCPYCGAEDRLPEDELGRVLEIKARLAQAEAKAAHVRGFDAALATLFEDPRSFLRAAGGYLGFGALLLLACLWQFLERAPAPALAGTDRARGLVGQLIGPFILLGLVASFGVALWVGRHHYRKSLRPLLWARLPVRLDWPFACRVCGGALPSGSAGSALCPYCSTANLVPPPLHDHHLAALQAEAEAASRRLHGAGGALVGISARMRSTLCWCVLAIFLLGYALARGLMAALG